MARSWVLRGLGAGKGELPPHFLATAVSCWVRVSCRPPPLSLRAPVPSLPHSLAFQPLCSIGPRSRCHGPLSSHVPRALCFQLVPWRPVPRYRLPGTPPSSLPWALQEELEFTKLLICLL